MREKERLLQKEQKQDFVSSLLNSPNKERSRASSSSSSSSSSNSSSSSTINTSGISCVTGNGRSTGQGQGQELGYRNNINNNNISNDAAMDNNNTSDARLVEEIDSSIGISINLGKSKLKIKTFKHQKPHSSPYWCSVYCFMRSAALDCC